MADKQKFPHLLVSKWTSRQKSWGWQLQVVNRKNQGLQVVAELAGDRLGEVVNDAEYNKSGSYWSWGNRQKAGRKSFEQEVSNEALDENKTKKLWELSAKLVGLS